MGLSLLADPISALSFFDRSWYRGTHWQPLRFDSAAAPPAVALSTGSSFGTTLLAVVKDVVLTTEKSTIWATAVDPTTATDLHTTPADRGPDL